MTMKILDSLFDAFSSLWLSCVLLVLLGLLTWLGTLYQVEHGLFAAQVKYFDSLFLIHQAGPVAIPLPGGTLVMGILFVNLVCGGIVRMRKTKATVGILVTHVGILMLIAAGFVKAYYSEDGHVTLYEGQRSNLFESYHHWEVAITEPLPSGEVRESVAAQEDFYAAGPGQPALLRTAGLPFDVEISRFYPNCDVFPKGPMVGSDVPVVDGYFLQARPLEKDNEANVAGAYVTLVGRDGKRREAILHGQSRAPLNVEYDGRRFGVALRREQWVMPFTVALEDFEKEDHPRMMMPKSFSSDVVVVEEALDVRELETAVLGPAGNPRVSVVGEIVPAAEFYDFDDKYRDGAAQTVVPADLPHELAEQARSLAHQAARALRVDGMARVDLFLVEGRGLLVNEVNTIPGFTPISMYPVLWEASGVGYAELLDELVALALARHRTRAERG